MLGDLPTEWVAEKRLLQYINRGFYSHGPTGPCVSAERFVIFRWDEAKSLRRDCLSCRDHRNTVSWD
ncbi:hypothetical protein THTE_2821 [Thermogutta terrifontis]|uniref:Uncharacterized protein n=1 Tax=Thermogutta terrifontis TaxID=1331910 RepID=A0A286RHI7_9BACT|nr:hypothetical protein THTE_2821 [Thermogutta terrifontis]